MSFNKLRIKDREYRKFLEAPDGEPAVRIGGSGTIISGVEYDSLSASYPTSTTEIYTYYQGGLSGTLVATVTVTYTTASKNEIVSVVRS